MSTTGNRKFGAQKRYSAAGSTQPRSTGTTRQAAPLTGGITRPSRSRCLIRDGGFDGTLIDALMAIPSRYTDLVERRIGPSSNDRQIAAFSAIWTAAVRTFRAALMASW